MEEGLMPIDGTSDGSEVAMQWQDRIIIDPKILEGKPVIKGTRIAVELIMDLLRFGWTTEGILHEYDHLCPVDIQACVAYTSDVLKTERDTPITEEQWLASQDPDFLL